MSTTDTPLTRLLNISEVAEILGVDVRHVRRLVHERRIPYLKWGHLLRFDPAEIDAWLDQSRQGVAARRS
jgi:excisionase family DNA binding protein